jgi:hypothetical protein
MPKATIRIQTESSRAKKSLKRFISIQAICPEKLGAKKDDAAQSDAPSVHGRPEKQDKKQAGE